MRSRDCTFYSERHGTLLILCFTGVLRRPDCRVVVRHITGFWEGWRFATHWKSIASGEGDRLRTESAFIVGNLTVSSQILFAARLLFILTVALTKCSVTLLLARITPIKKHLIGCYTLLTLCGLWGLASFIAEATHCLPRQPWAIAQPVCSDFVCHYEINKSEVCS